jgi:hypothetical protein
MIGASLPRRKRNQIARRVLVASHNPVEILLRLVSEPAFLLDRVVQMQTKRAMTLRHGGLPASDVLRDFALDLEVVRPLANVVV